MIQLRTTKQKEETQQNGKIKLRTTGTVATQATVPSASTKQGSTGITQDGKIKLRTTQTVQTPVTSVQNTQRTAEQMALDPNASERKYEGISLQDIWDTIKGASKQTAAAYVNNAATAVKGEAERQKQQMSGEITAWKDTIKAYQDVLNDKSASISEKETATNVITDLQRKIDAYNKAYGESGANDQAAKKIYSAADTVQQSGAQDIERASEGKNTVNRLLLQAGVAGTQMVEDALMAPPGAGLVPMFFRAFGGASQKARQEGADYDTANTYGGASAVVEVLTEKMFDGVAGIMGKGAADDIVSKFIAKYAKNGVLGRMLSYTASAAGESLEEVVSGLIDPALQSMYNKKTYSENFDAVELLESAIVGGMLGLIGGNKTYKEAKAVRDATQSAQQTNTQTEAVQQSNLTQETENGVEGEKIDFTLKKNEPEAQVQEQMTQDGKIKLRTTQNENGMPSFGGVQNDVLTDSEGRTYENIAAEQKVQLEKPEAYKLANKLGNLTNRKVKWFTDADKSKSGFYDRNTNTIWMNTESENPAAQVFAHELTHSLEQTDSYYDLETLVFQNMIKKNGREYIDAQRKSKKELYKRHGVTLQDDVAINHEIVSEYVEKYLLTNEKEIQRICQTNRSIGQRILQKINELLAKIGFSDAKQRAYLENARNIYAEALAESNRTSESDLETARAELQGELERGEITQEEYDEAVLGMDFGQEAMDGVQFAINPDFEKEIENWDGKQPETFTIGTTSSALKSIGVKDRVIKWTSDSLMHSLKHPGMSMEVAKQVPKLLENPVSVMQSRSVYDRIVMLGEVYDENGTPVLAVLEVNPKKDNGEILDMNIANNVYGKDRGIENFLKLSNYLYLDPNKKRTDTWFQSLGLQLPSGNTMYGSIGNISYADGDVKIQGIPWEKLAGEPFVQFSITETRDLPIEQQLSMFRNGKMNRYSEFYFGETPDTLVGKGLSKLPLAMSQSDMAKTKSEKHNVPNRAIKAFAKNLNDAILSFETEDSIGVLTKDIDGDGKPLLIGIHKNVELDNEKVNRIKSAYGLDNPKEWIKNQIESGKKLRIFDIEKADRFLNYVGYKAERTENYQLGDIIQQVSENVKKQFSITEQEQKIDEPIFGKAYGMTSNNLFEDVNGQTYEEKLRAGMSERNKLPTKAKNRLHRAERYAEVSIGESMGVPKAAQNEYMRPIVQEISEEYLKTGKVSRETQNRLFDAAYDNGIVADNDFYEQYKDIKTMLRKKPVQISEADAHDIPDYGLWKKSVFGTLNIVSSGGVPVDVMYEQMNDIAPELFPSSITSPSDQIQKMAEVGKSITTAEKTLQEYYGKNAEEHKRWHRNNFDSAINEQLSELKKVKAYADDRAQKIKGPKQITTQEELNEAYMALKDARRAYEKANNKALLTDSDRAKVGQLLRGEITEEALNPETDNVKDIKAVYAAKKPYEEVTKVIRNYNKQRRAGLNDLADVFLQTANEWKDKKMGIAYARETMERNVRDIVPDAELADAIVDTYFKPVHDAQAASTRMKNEFRNRIRNLNLSREVDKKHGNHVSEAYAVQLYGEAMDNIKMLENSRGKLKMRDGKTLADWQGVITELWKDNPGIDRGKVEMAVEEFRDAYDELFQKMNETRLRNGYEPINYRKGYFPHFQPQQNDGLLGLFGKAIGLQTEVTALPTQINGITHMFKPGIQWFGNAQERLGFSTAYDAVEGFDKYIEGAADVIYQTDNIQKLRALASQVRYRTSDEGIQKQVDEVLANDNRTENEKKNDISAIYESGRFKLSNFAVELDEYTNLLANKKSKADRNMEQMIGRDSYNAVKALESRVAANMVAINPASWLTNFIPITQAWGAVDSKHILQGMWGTLKNYKTSDGMKEASTFLTNREGSEPLVRTKEQEWSAKLSSPMEWIDQFTAGSIVRARFLQNVDRGMSAAEALSDADAFAAGVMADRSKGSMPTLFYQSNPFTKVLTQFQLEVNNQLSYVFKDLPRGKKEEGAKALAIALFKFFLGAYLYDNVYEFFIGRRPALDPIGILNDTVGDLTGYELPSIPEAIEGMSKGETFGEQFQTEKKSRLEALGGAIGDALEDIPFVGGLLGGGRVPISSALPNVENLFNATFSEDMNPKKRWNTIAKELTAPATYILPPFGGGQIKKLYQGEKAVLQGGSYTVDSQGRDVLQYPVYSDNANDIFQNAFVAGLFGKTATKEGQEWIKSGFKNLSAKETQAYKDMQDAGATQKESYALIKETKAVGEDAGYKEEVAKVIMASDATDEAKAELYYNVYATESEQEKIDTMTKNGMSKWGAVKMLMEGRAKDVDTEDLLMQSKEVSDAKKAEIYFAQYASDSEIEAYKEYGNGISKAKYYQFLVKTDGMTADKDANGKSISGSKKKKVLAVIDAMDLTVDQKNAMYYMAGYTESTLYNDAPWYNLKFKGQK